MLMFILNISCLTTSNFPWFMVLTFLVPIQYCSLQHQILLSSPDTTTTEHHTHFDPAISFILRLLVILFHSSPQAYWIPSDLRNSYFGVTYFWPFIQFMRFSRQVHWGGLPFLPPADHVFFRTVCYDPSIHLGWPCMAWLIASLSYTNHSITSRL